MTEKRFTIDVENNNYENAFFLGDKFICYEDDYDSILKLLNVLHEENQRLKYQNEMLSDELEQCKAVIDKKWSEYLKKKSIEF